MIVLGHAKGPCLGAEWRSAIRLEQSLHSILGMAFAMGPESYILHYEKVPLR
jgi:hypothetical protein